MAAQGGAAAKASCQNIQRNGRVFAILAPSVLITYWVKYKGTRFPIRHGETIVGRSPYCSIVITDDLVSREHCALRLTNQGLSVTDLRSTNGLKLNGKALAGAHPLKAGDILTVGTAVLEVMEVDAAAHSAARRTRSQADDPPPPTEDHTPTLLQANTLDLIDALLNGRPEATQLEAVAVTVTRILDDLLQGLEADQRREGATPTLLTTSATLADFAHRTAQLFPDGSYSAWREQFVQKIEALTK